jgi:hypothetical protein
MELKNSYDFLDIINLKHSDLILMLSEINSIAEYFLDEDGSKISFHISKGTDETFLWKLTIKIECLKV